MKKYFLLALAASVIIAIGLIACSKESSNSNADKSTTVKVRMTDAPFSADEVNVDLQQVRVNFRDDSTGWVDLNTIAGVYDLLGLQNGIDTLIASGTIPSNSVREIRFVLGSNNTIKVAGTVYPLTIPSGSESGLKIKVNKQLNGPVDSLLIDFDAALSIHVTGNGDYMLKPVLKIK